MPRLGKAFIEVRADLSRFPGELREKLKAAFKEGVKGASFTEVEDEAEKAGTRAADRAAKGFEKKSKTVLRKAGEKGGRDLGNGLLDAVAKTLASRAAVLGGLVSAIVAAGFAAAPAVLALGAASPAGLVAIAATAGVLAAAFRGVGDAVKEAFSGDDPAALQAAMENLAPAAQRFVRELAALKPILTDIRKGIQEEFFREFGTAVQSLVTKLLPALNADLRQLAADLGFAGGAFGHLVTQSKNVSTIRTAFHELALGVGEALAGTPALTQAIITLIGAAAPFARILIGSLGPAMERFGALIEQASESGGLATLFESGLSVLGQLAGLVGSLVGLVSTILTQLNAGGQGLFSTITGIVGAFNDFFRSAEGATLLVGLREVSDALGDVLIPLLETLLPIVGEIIGELGVGLGGALRQLSPGLIALGEALVVGLSPLTGIVNELFQKLLPVFFAFSEAVAKIAPPLGEMVALLLNAAGDVLLESVDALVPALLNLLPVLAQLAVDLLPLLPPILLLAVKLLTALLPVIGFLLEIFTAILGPVGAFIGFLAEAVAAFLDFVIVDGIVKALDAFLESVDGGIQIVRDFGSAIADFFRGGGAGNFLEDTGESIEKFFTKTIPDAFDAVVGFFADLPGRIAEGLTDLRTIILDAFVGALKATIDFIAEAIGNTIGLFFALPFLIKTAMDKIPGIILGIFDAAFELISGAVTETFDLVVGFFTEFIPLIFRKGGEIGEGLVSTFRDAVASARQFVIDGFNAALDFIGTLPDKIRALGPKLLEAAKSLGRKIGDGLGEIGNFASDIGRKIVNAVKSGINFVIDGINRGIGEIDAKIPFDLPRLPRFERGGIVDTPTVALLGEGSKREVVVPLTDPARAQELAKQSGLTEILRSPSGWPQINITAYMDGVGVIRIIKTEIDGALSDQGQELAFGPRG